MRNEMMSDGENPGIRPSNLLKWSLVALPDTDAGRRMVSR